MRLDVLGPLVLTGAAGPVDVPGHKTRQLLTVLALDAPGALTLSQLVDVLWDDAPPSAAKTVQSYLSRARAALARAGARGALSGGPQGYALALDARASDVSELAAQRDVASAARARGDWAAAAEALRAARALWRGAPELPDTLAGRAWGARLAEERLATVEAHLEAQIAAGESAPAAAELELLTATEPRRERLWELRMLALYHSGRQSDALRAYQDLRAVLREEVGVEPSPALRELERAVLDQRVPPVRSARPAERGVARDIRYARAGDAHVATRTFGSSGPPVLLLNPSFISVDAFLDEPHLAAAIERLAAGRRVHAFDRRGTGLSDPLRPGAELLRTWVEDAVAVADAHGSETFDVFANSEAGLVGLALAAAHPERVRSLTLVNGFARYRRATAIRTASPKTPSPRSSPACNPLTPFAPTC